MDALATLQRLGQGRLIDKLAEAIASTADEVVRTGNPGEVSLKLKLTNHGPGDVMVTVEETLGRRPPSEPARGAVFVSVNGQLWKEDPRQGSMEFRTVDGEGVIVDVPSDQPVVREVAS